MNDLFAGTEQSLAAAYRRMADTEPESEPVKVPQYPELETPPDLDTSKIEGIWLRQRGRFKGLQRLSLGEAMTVDGEELDKAEVHLSNGYSLYLLKNSFGWTASWRPPDNGNVVRSRPIHLMGARRNTRTYPQTVGEGIMQWAGYLL